TPDNTSPPANREALGPMETDMATADLATADLYLDCTYDQIKNMKPAEAADIVEADTPATTNTASQEATAKPASVANILFETEADEVLGNAVPQPKPNGVDTPVGATVTQLSGQTSKIPTTQLDIAAAKSFLKMLGDADGSFTFQTFDDN